MKSKERDLLRLAVPNMLSNLTVPLAGLIDTALLGHLDEIVYLAGVALGSILFDFLYWLFGFFRMSTTGLTAQALGRGDKQDLTIIPVRTLLLALTIGCIILLLSQPISVFGFGILDGTPDVIQQGKHYFSARIWGAPVVLMNFSILGWLLGMGKGKRILTLSVVANGSNIILDYLFIFKFGWGSKGAGYATMISQYVMFAFGMAYALPHIMANKKVISWRRLFNKDELRKMLSLNRDIFIRTLTLIASFSYFTNASSAMGTLILAANTILLKVISISSYFIDGLAYAVESLAGRHKGAGETRQLHSTIQTALLSSAGIAIFFSALFILMPQPLFKLLTNQTEVLAELFRHRFWLLPVMLLGSSAYIWDGIFLGLSEGKILRNCMLFSALVFYFPLALLSSNMKNVDLLWLSLSLFMGARTITLWIHYQKRKIFKGHSTV
ncbi:MAG: MATE family efflux transporter [Acidobacteria bacterium]|nr:MAG: MATE family efflux transporter [Acidobacteriota bacterium]